MYRQYKDRADFHVVYIEEAHANDGWQLPVNVRQRVVFSNPKTDEERSHVAGACVRKLNIAIPALLDGIGNGVERAYTGWPDRLYVIDRRGRVAYKSAPGPFGFTPPAMEKALLGALSRD